MAKVNRKLVIRVMLNKHSPLSIGHLASFCENRPEFPKQKTDVQRSPAGGKESGVQALPVRKQGGKGIKFWREEILIVVRKRKREEGKSQNWMDSQVGHAGWASGSTQSVTTSRFPRQSGGKPVRRQDRGDVCSGQEVVRQEVTRNCCGLLSALTTIYCLHSTSDVGFNLVT